MIRHDPPELRDRLVLKRTSTPVQGHNVSPSYISEQPKAARAQYRTLEGADSEIPSNTYCSMSLELGRRESRFRVALV